MSHLSPDAAANFLGVTFSVGSNGPDLEQVIKEAEAALGRRCGPLEPTVMQTTVTASQGCVGLPHHPIVSIESVRDLASSSTLTLGPDDLDPDTGVVTNALLSQGVRYRFAYTAGWAEVPDDLHRAALELVRHLWQKRRPPTPRVSNGRTTAQDRRPASTTLWPREVEELIADLTMDGFA